MYRNIVVAIELNEEISLHKPLLSAVELTRRAAGVSPESIRDFEMGRSDPRQSTLGKIEEAFRQAGLVLFEEAGGRRGARSE